MMADWKEMLSSLYGVGADAKNFLFDTGLIDSASLTVPVLSVGNLSMGGTGKTPVVQTILQLALDRGAKPLVVARNYMARSRGVHRLELSRPDGALYYGDEAFMLAQKFPTIPVWTGPKKYLTAQYAARADRPDFVLVDDGFQHRSLHRDFDFVLLDATEDLQNEALVPIGRLREGFSSLERAHLIGLTKVNWASEERMIALRRKLPEGKPVLEIEFHTAPRNASPEGCKVIAVSGIANPKVFEQSLKIHPEFEVVSHSVYPDHYAYGPADVDAILRKTVEAGAMQILTTEKDFVKLQVYPQLKELLNPIELTLTFRNEAKELYEFLDRSRRH
jgi:tetraacyldisaccharide 4'-kinase